MESKSIAPLPSVTNEIKNDIAQQAFSEELKQILDPVQATLNPDYFNGKKTIEWTTGPAGENEGRPQPQRAPQRPQP